MSDIRENEYIDTQILALRSKYHEIQSENQPVGNEIQIGTDRDNGAAITFSILPQTGEEEQRQVSEQMAVIRNDMKKIWKQNVFYDIGEVVAENTPVAWMDFKHTVLMEIFTVSFLCFRRKSCSDTKLDNFIHISEIKYHNIRLVSCKLSIKK